MDRMRGEIGFFKRVGCKNLGLEDLEAKNLSNSDPWIGGH